MKHTLIEIDYPTKRIKMEDQWYIRVGPACWYIENDTGFEAANYYEATETENKYQCLKQS